MIIRDKVKQALLKHHDTVMQISLYTGLTRQQVLSCIRDFRSIGLVKLIGKRPHKKTSISIYSWVKNEKEQESLRFEHERNILNSKNTQRDSEKKRRYFRDLVTRDEPFSQNEEHYGREGKKYTWDDVKHEASLVQYRENNKLNELVKYIEE